MNLKLRIIAALVSVLLPFGMVLSGSAKQAVVAKRTVVCSNTRTDDSLINSAIGRSQIGAEIVIDGPCLIDATIKLRGNRAYRGMSRTGTVIRQADDANLPAMMASDAYLDNRPFTGDPISLHSLTLDGNKSHNPDAWDALVLRSWQSTVEDVQIANARRHGLRITNKAANGTALKNTQVNGRIANNYITGSGERGIYIDDSGNAVTDWQLVDNWIASSGSDGIVLANAAGWYVERNHIYGVLGVALRAERLFATSINDNYIEDFRTNGIEVSVQGASSSVISSNRVFGSARAKSAGAHVLVRQVNYGTGNLVVSGNSVVGGGTGIGFAYHVGNGVGLNVASSGNLVQRVESPQEAGARVALTSGI